VTDLKRKIDAEEMLVVHKPALKPDPGKSGRERGDAAPIPATAEELELMQKRLAQAKDAREKRRLLAEIQRRFGNEKAGQAIQELRQGGDDDAPPPPPSAGHEAPPRA
jgi:hypothetical protein